MTEILSKVRASLPNSLAARGRSLPPRRDQSPVPLSAAGAPLDPELSRIVRRQAIGNWMLPSLSIITPRYIEGVLRGAIGGNHLNQWELFDLMEDTWPRLTKALGELKGAVVGMEWKLEAWAEDDQPPTDSALERKKLVSNALWRMQPAPDQDDNGFEQTIADILDAWAKGASVLEILWETRRVGQLGDLTVPNSTAWVHPINYAWSEEGFLGLNSSADGGTGYFNSRPTAVNRFPDNKFLVALRKAKSGPALTSALLRPLAWWWCAANFSADWLMNLAQLFGIPFRWATYSTAASDDTVTKIGNLLANLGSNGYGAFPEGTNLNFLDAGKNAGSSPQADLLERADKYCDLLILGQTLTSEAGRSSGGGSLALGRVHEGVREEILQSASDFVARVLNQQLIPAILRENYGDAEEAPYLCPEPETVEDEKANADRDAVLLTQGVVFPKKWFYERHAIPLPQPGEETISGAAGSAAVPSGQPQPPGTVPASKPAAAGPTDTAAPPPKQDSAALQASRANPTPEENFVAEVAAKIDPVLALLHRITEMKDDAAMLRAFDQFLAQADTIKNLVTADVTRTQRALEKITAPALAKGLAGK